MLIRTDAVDMLRDAGFDVIETVNADEAIMILEGGSTIDFVLTDIQMPGSMDGLNHGRVETGCRRQKTLATD